MQLCQKLEELSGFEVCNSRCITKGHPKNMGDFFPLKVKGFPAEYLPDSEAPGTLLGASGKWPTL